MLVVETKNRMQLFLLEPNFCVQLLIYISTCVFALNMNAFVKGHNELNSLALAIFILNYLAAENSSKLVNMHNIVTATQT